jgi:hypothetical protein
MTANKYTAKTTQDGIELTWNLEENRAMTADEVAKFYVDSAKALQKFKADDPRTMPELRRAASSKKNFWNNVFWLIVGCFLMFAFVSVMREWNRNERPWLHDRRYSR